MQVELEQEKVTDFKNSNALISTNQLYATHAVRGDKKPSDYLSSFCVTRKNTARVLHAGRSIHVGESKGRKYYRAEQNGEFT